MAGKPLPTSLKLFKGTLEKHRVNGDEPRPANDNIVKPDTLSKVADKQWDKIVSQLIACGIMTNLDADALALYCEVYATWTEANKELQRFGIIVKSSKGHPMPSPFLRIAENAFNQLRAMMVEFGMTPSSRSRLRATPPPDKNEFDDIG